MYKYRYIYNVGMLLPGDIWHAKHLLPLNLLQTGFGTCSPFVKNL